MNDVEELAALRRLAELEAKEGAAASASTLGVVLTRSSSQQRARDVSQNAAREAVAGVGDMFLNAPTNAWNLGKALVGMGRQSAGPAMAALGKEPFPMPELSQAPDVLRGQFEKRGWITPQDAPQTTGERYLSAGTQGATAGAVGGPAGMLLGAAGNLLGQGVSDATGSPMAGLAANLATGPAGNAVRNHGTRAVEAARVKMSQEAPLIEAMKRVRDAGYVIPPGMTNPTIGNRVMESVGGKQALTQDASVRNEDRIAAGARKDAGLPPDAPVTELTLKNRQAAVAQPYEDIRELPGLPPKQYGTFSDPDGPPASLFTGATPPTPAVLLEQWKTANRQAQLEWAAYQRNRLPDQLKAYESEIAKSQQLHSQMEAAALAAGRPDLIPKLQAARQDYAKLSDIIRALNPADVGEVSALKLARAQAANVPLSGELETAAIMGNRFSKAVQDPKTVGTPGAHNLSSMLGGALGGTFGALAGSGAGPVGIGAGGALGSAAGAMATPMVKALIRNHLLSKGYQAKHGTPDYSPGSFAQGASTMDNNYLNAALRAYLQSQQQGQQP